MNFYLSVFFCAFIAVRVESTCNVKKATMMVMDYESALKSPPTGDIISLNDYEKDKYFAGVILAADVTQLCKKLYNKINDLQMISFSDIPIETFEDGLFDGASSLENLEFDGITADRIKAGIFKNIEKLEELEFGNTPIENIDVGAFENLPVLETFVLTHSKIHRINPQWFVNCPKIIDVNFSYNKIKTLHTGDFSFMKPGVQHSINLAHNKIKVIESGTFTSKQLTVLNLESNHIRGLKNTIFTKLRKSDKINLTNNRFSCIDHDTLITLKLFSTVILDDNSAEDGCDKSKIISQLHNVEWNN